MPHAVRARRLAVALGLAALALASGCRASGPGSAPEAGIGQEADDREPLEPTTLQVHNHHRTDVVIYLVRGTVRSRVGQVTSGATGSWTLPEVAVRDAGGIFLIADPVGGRAVLRSDRLVLQPGRRVVWTLESGLARSSLAVY